MYKKYEMEIITFKEADSYVQAQLSVVDCDDSSSCPPYSCSETSFMSFLGDC